MSFPQGVQTVTVEGTVSTSDGDGIFEHITFTPSVPQVISTDLNIIIDTKAIDVTVDKTTGQFSVELIATDASGFNPTGWTYTVSRGTYPDYSISLPAAVPTVNLADITPVVADTTVYNLLVRYADVETAIDASVAAAVPPAVQNAVLTYPGLTTGIMAGGSMDPHPTNPIAVTVQPLRGYIVNALVEPPTIATVTTTSTLTIQLDAAAQARAATWFLMDANQNVTQQEALPTAQQRREYLVLGTCSQASGVIRDVQSIPVIPQQPINQLYDLIDSIGSFSISGNAVSPNGANLSLNHVAGKVFSRGWGHYIGANQTDSPHIVDTIGETPANWYMVTRSTNTFGTPSTTIDVSHYDNNGVVTAIGGGTNSATNIRLWVYPTSDSSESHVAQYGQTVYSNLAAAQAAIGSTFYVTNPALPQHAVLLAVLSVIRTATNLSDTTQALITAAGKFRYL